MNLKKILTEAQELISDPYRWANELGDHEFDRRDCQCAATAIWKVMEQDGTSFSIRSDEALTARTALAKAAGLNYRYGEDWYGIYSWNDQSSHDVVMTAFDKAIAAS